MSIQGTGTRTGVYDANRVLLSRIQFKAVAERVEVDEAVTNRVQYDTETRRVEANASTGRRLDTRA